MTNYSEVIADLEKNLANAQTALANAQTTVYRHEGALIIVRRLQAAQQKEAAKPVTTVAANDWRETGIFYECD